VRPSKSGLNSVGYRSSLNRLVSSVRCNLWSLPMRLSKSPNWFEFMMNDLVLCSGVGIDKCSCKSDESYALLNAGLNVLGKVIKVIYTLVIKNQML